VKAVTEIIDEDESGKTITKKFIFDHIHGKPHYALETKYLPMLAEAGIGPQIHEIGEDYIVMEKLRDFKDWYDHLDPRRTRNVSKREMFNIGTKVCERIHIMQSLGIAHRDLHHRNLLLDNDMNPMFIDMELSCDADPNGSSYDLYGPIVSGIRPPEIHETLKIQVWWDTGTGKSQGMGKVFGPLHRYTQS
jgi:serine/threonine protein kinase